MFGWALGFFVAAIIAAMFGFGVVASTFAGIAMILFWVFVGLLVVSLLLSLFSGHRVSVAGDSHAHVSRGPGLGTLGLVAVAAIVGILAYSWVKNDWSAEQAGRAIDQNAAEITADAGNAIESAGDRAENLITNTGADCARTPPRGSTRPRKPSIPTIATRPRTINAPTLESLLPGRTRPGIFLRAYFLSFLSFSFFGLRFSLLDRC